MQKWVQYCRHPEGILQERLESNCSITLSIKADQVASPHSVQVRIYTQQNSKESHKDMEAPKSFEAKNMEQPPSDTTAATGSSSANGASSSEASGYISSSSISSSSEASGYSTPKDINKEKGTYSNYYLTT